MKKLMLSAFLAVLAIVSCNKQESVPVNSNLRSVEFSINNKILTKAAAGEKINDGDAVQVSNIKVYLTDAAGNTYDATDVDGVTPSQTYFQKADLTSGSISAVFHYVDPNCTKIIAVANLGDVDLATAKAKVLEIADQQDSKKLALYAEGDLKSAGKQHTETAADGTEYVSDVYEAELTLTPRISRFEVDGFNVTFNDTPKYNEIKISQLSFHNYYPKTSLATGVEAGELVTLDFTKQADVYAWMNNGETGKWYKDDFDLTVTPADNVKDLATPLAYHMFSCTTTPVVLIKLTVDGQPAFLYSKNFRKADGTEIKNFEEGYIYRMSAAGDTNGDGNIPFDEEDIDPMDRCIEITVNPVKWIVELVYPEF